MNGRHTVETLVVLKPIAVETGSADRAGMLVLANGRLVAVLVRLDGVEHALRGHWFLEMGLGRLRDLRPPAFSSVEEATRWVRRHLKP